MGQQTTLSKSFTATGAGGAKFFKRGDYLQYTVSGTFSATAVLQRSINLGASWETIATKTAAASDKFLVPDDAMYRWSCTVYASGTMVTTIYDAPAATNDLIIPCVNAKAGATAGWVVNGGADTFLTTCPQSQTASTLVIPITGLKPGDIITGFGIIGQIESAGGAVTLDAELKRHDAVAADVTTTSIGSMTQVSVAADTALVPASHYKDGLGEVVVAGATYFLLLTATTAASTDIALQGVVVNLKA